MSLLINIQKLFVGFNIKDIRGSLQIPVLPTSEHCHPQQNLIQLSMLPEVFSSNLQFFYINM